MQRAISQLFLCLAIIAPELCIAGPPKGAVLLASEQMFETASGLTTITCGNLPPWVPGRVTKGYFLPTSTEMKELKKKAKATKDKKKKGKYNKSIAKLKGYLSTATPVCSSGPPPTSNGNFDAQGNVTAAGKMAFGIPSSISANVNNGIAAWNSNCKGCHNGFPSSLPIKSYPGIASRIVDPPMSFLVPGEISYQTIAEIVAFANY